MKLKSILKNEKGGAYIEFLVSLSIFLVAAILILSVMGIFSAKNNLDNVADTLIKIAETEGTTNLDYTIEEMRATSGLDFAVNWDGTDYLPGSNKVQLGNVIKIDVSDEYQIGVGEFAHTIEMHSRREGMSEKYHK